MDASEEYSKIIEEIKRHSALLDKDIHEGIATSVSVWRYDLPIADSDFRAMLLQAQGHFEAACDELKKREDIKGQSYDVIAKATAVLISGWAMLAQNNEAFKQESETTMKGLERMYKSVCPHIFFDRIKGWEMGRN